MNKGQSLGLDVYLVSGDDGWVCCCGGLWTSDPRLNIWLWMLEIHRGDQHLSCSTYPCQGNGGGGNPEKIVSDCLWVEKGKGLQLIPDDVPLKLVHM